MYIYIYIYIYEILPIVTLVNWNNFYFYFYYFFYFFMEMKLRMELRDGQIFQGWQEGIIKFAPTYKYYPNSDSYYGCLEDIKGEKRRAPAW